MAAVRTAKVLWRVVLHNVDWRDYKAIGRAWRIGRHYGSPTTGGRWKS